MIWEKTHLYRIALVIIGLLIHFGGKLLPLGKLPFDFKWKVVIGAFIFL